MIDWRLPMYGLAVDVVDLEGRIKLVIRIVLLMLCGLRVELPCHCIEVVRCPRTLVEPDLFPIVRVRNRKTRLDELFRWNHTCDRFAREDVREEDEEDICIRSELNLP